MEEGETETERLSRGTLPAQLLISLSLFPRQQALQESCQGPGSQLETGTEFHPRAPE